MSVFERMEKDRIQNELRAQQHSQQAEDKAQKELTAFKASIAGPLDALDSFLSEEIEGAKRVRGSGHLQSIESAHLCQIERTLWLSFASTGASVPYEFGMKVLLAPGQQVRVSGRERIGTAAPREMDGSLRADLGTVDHVDLIARLKTHLAAIIQHAHKSRVWASRQ